MNKDAGRYSVRDVPMVAGADTSEGAQATAGMRDQGKMPQERTRVRCTLPTEGPKLTTWLDADHDMNQVHDYRSTENLQSQKPIQVVRVVRYNVVAYTIRSQSSR